MSTRTVKFDSYNNYDIINHPFIQYVQSRCVPVSLSCQFIIARHYIDIRQHAIKINSVYV